MLIHGGGGVGQTPDYWGNDYFDDTYLHNGEREKFSGYCTDVGSKPPKSSSSKTATSRSLRTSPPTRRTRPYLVDEKYAEPYRKLGVPSPRAEFYGMIANIDENVARLDATLTRLGLAENTILIFTTDNGTAAGMRGKDGFNAGLRGTKGSEYEGGHRVPCFIRWPAGHLAGTAVVAAPTAHIDILPTLIELCQLKTPANVRFDGVSLVPLLKGSAETLNRTLFVHSQRIDHPEKWRQCAVMTDQWRLVDGKELYEIGPDLGQNDDVAAKHPDVVEKLRGEYEKWWDDISTRFDEYVPHRTGLAARKSHHAHLPRLARADRTNSLDARLIEKSPIANGFWAVDIVRDGKYEITLRDRPAYATPHPLPAGTRDRGGQSGIAAGNSRKRGVGDIHPATQSRSRHAANVDRPPQQQIPRLILRRCEAHRVVGVQPRMARDDSDEEMSLRNAGREEIQIQLFLASWFPHKKICVICEICGCICFTWRLTRAQVEAGGFFVVADEQQPAA